jgi:signal peptidase
MVNRRASFDRIREGDVIAFETAVGMVTHRVVRKDGEWLETKGDANDISDGYTTTRENYRGKTIFSVPYLGYLHFAVSRYRIVLAGLLVLFTLYNGTREMTDRNRGRFDEFLQKK